MIIDPRISAAETLEELHAVLVEINGECLRKGVDPETVYDPMSLPTFGGEDIERVPGLYSWDENRVLAGDSTDEADIVDREPWIKLGEG